MSLKSWCRRKTIWLYAKIVREKASPEYIARGWAIGMFYGCLIPFGLQLICSVPTAFLLKGSKIGAVVGTLITNHFTIFFIYPLQCWVGSILIGRSLSYEKIQEMLHDVLEEQSWDALLEAGEDLVASFFVGGLLLTVLMTPLTYFFVLKLVNGHRRRKALKAARADAAAAS